jgi:hypothetical protein
MTGETLSERLARFEKETLIDARALIAAKRPVKLPGGLGWAPTSVLARWALTGGPLRGPDYFVRFVCDALTPTVAAIRANVEPDGPRPFATDPYADPPEPRADRARAQKPTLSAVVSAHNEEDKLAACLGRLGFADEIVVLLDNCTDGTKAVAEAYADTVVEGAWPLEGDRRNAAVAACNGAWVLEVDADEHVTPDLAKEIRKTVRASAFDAHEIPVDNMIGPKLVREGWGASYGKAAYPGLFRAGVKTWGRQRVHPSLSWSGTAGMGPMLENRIVHYVDRGVADMIRRLDSYSTARAKDLAESGRREALSQSVRRFVSRFQKCYIARGGHREGGYGFLIALFAGLYPVLSAAKARELQDGGGTP